MGPPFKVCRVKSPPASLLLFKYLEILNVRDRSKSSVTGRAPINPNSSSPNS